MGGSSHCFTLADMMKLAWLFWEIEWDEDGIHSGNGRWLFKETRDEWDGDDRKWKRIVYCEVEE